MLERRAAVRGNQQSFAARDYDRALFGIGHGQGVLQHAEIAQSLSLVAQHDGTAVAGQFEDDPGPAGFDQPYAIRTGRFLPEIPFPSLGCAGDCRPLRRPPHVRRLVAQGPVAGLGIDLDQQCLAFQAERSRGRGSGQEESQEDCENGGSCGHFFGNVHWHTIGLGRRSLATTALNTTTATLCAHHRRTTAAASRRVEAIAGAASLC